MWKLLRKKEIYSTNANMEEEAKKFNKENSPTRLHEDSAEMTIPSSEEEKEALLLAIHNLVKDADVIEVAPDLRERMAALYWGKDQIPLTLISYEKEQKSGRIASILIGGKDEEGIENTNFHIRMDSSGNFEIEKRIVHEKDLTFMDEFLHGETHESPEAAERLFGGLEKFEEKQEVEKKEGLIFVSKKDIKDLMLMLKEAVPIPSEKIHSEK